MKKALSIVVMSVCVLIISGCISVGGPKDYSHGIKFNASNDASKTLDISTFEGFSTVLNVLEEMEIDQFTKKTNTKEAVVKFAYQNLNYTVTLDYVSSDLTKFSVGAKSNGMFKNRALAADFLVKIIETQD